MRFLLLFFQACENGAVGESHDDTRDHQTHPHQDQVVPANGGNGVGKQHVCGGCCHVAEEVQKSGGAGNHARVTQAGAIATPEHGGGGVGGHDGKHHQHDVDRRDLDEIYQEEKHRGKGEHQKNGGVHVEFHDLFVDEYRHKRGQGDHQGGGGIKSRGNVGGKVQRLGDVGGQPKDHRGTHHAGDDGDQGKFDDAMLEQHLDAATLFLFGLVLTVLNKPLFLKHGKACKKDDRHSRQGGAAGDKGVLPGKKSGKQSRAGRAYNGGKGVAKTATGGVDGL